MLLIANYLTSPLLHLLYDIINVCINIIYQGSAKAGLFCIILKR
nr:MAG TPA: hypothetical protein [Caudoviricetes sp.]